ncbi:hypothetical protein MTO96_005998 [Rhipicephalus appendiculatus]
MNCVFTVELTRQNPDMTAMVIVLLLLVLTSCGRAFDVEMTTSQGHMGGRRTGVLGRTVDEFRGIPYARPPLGRLRFRPPEPLQGWDGILDATTRRTACPQVAIGPPLAGGVEYTEDCLHLNVWTPRGTLPNTRSSTRVNPRRRLFPRLRRRRGFERRDPGRQDWVRRRVLQLPAGHSGIPGRQHNGCARAT